MMRHIFTVLPVLALCILAAGCTDNPGVQIRYQAEQLYFDAEKASQQADIRPDLNDPSVYTDLRAKYRETIEFCYAALDSLSALEYPQEYRELQYLNYQATNRLTQIYYADGDFDSCITELNRFIAGVPVEGAPRISAHLHLGQALQSKGLWDSALAVYDYSVNTFYPPTTGRGELVPPLFNLPLHILSVYLRTNDTVGVRMQFDAAEGYYQDLVRDYPNTETEAAAHTGLSRLYELAGDWNRAISELRMVRDSSTSVDPRSTMRIANIYATKLNRLDSAVMEFDGLLDRLKGRDTLRRPAVLFAKTNVLLDQKKYNEARELLTTLKHKYTKFFDETPAAQYAIARSFELQDNWDRAETEYRFLLEKYPSSEQAMATFVYLTDQYARQGRTLESERMEHRAETELDRIAMNRSGTTDAALALSYKAELYRRREDWPTTVGILVRLFEEFPKTSIGQQAVITASVIQRDKLNNGAAADSLMVELRKALTVDDNAEI
ncbi:MAG: tetratricopeptide repeat protein [candidate division Zixibacteria bacterium]|nr:tetratricopeptide repeat protein [candidate division Zixibacteria bacterium]